MDAYVALALSVIIAFGLISVSAFILLNALSIKLHEKIKVTRLMRTQTIYSMGSPGAQRLRDNPCSLSLYRETVTTYVAFCACVIALLVASLFFKEHVNVILALLFTACLSYTGWIVYRVSVASRNFVSVLRQD